MQRALLAGVFVAVAGAIVGVFVVLKGLAFLSDAVAHTSLTGAAVAFFAGGGLAIISIGAAVAAIATAVGVSMISRRTNLSFDTATGVLFIGLFSIGILLMSKTRNYALDLNSFLVGTILGVPTTDLIVMGVITGLIFILVIYFYREFKFVSYDPEMAAASGISVFWVQTTLLILVALAAVVAFRMVGVLLAMAMLVGPAATATLLANRLPWIMLMAAILGIVATVVGLYISFHLGFATGPSSALTAVAFFVLAFFGSAYRSDYRRESPRISQK